MAYTATDYKSFLEPSIVSKLNSLEIKAKLVVEGFIVGLHKSPYHGFSVEFSQHRPYIQGDSLKNVDWKVYGKTEKFFIKQFEEETNLKCHILVDISNSMSYNSEKNISKIEYAKTLAAALSYIMMKQQDAVGLALYSDKIQNYFPPKASKVYYQEILKNLSKVQSAKETNTANCLNEIAENIKKRGLVIIISDFFDDINSILTSLKHFRYKNNEVIVFQLLDPIEKNFSFSKDSVFRDLETEEELTTQPHQIQKAYMQTMSEYINKIKSGCLNSKIDYNLITTDTPFDKALFNYIQKREKLH